MAKQEHKQQGSGVPAAADGAADTGALGAKGAARRRFARAGAGATGVILTLASQPGMAAQVCASPSGFLSGTYASHAPSATCLGVSPGYWKNHHDQWKPQAGTDGTAKFSYVFPCTTRTALLKDYSLFDIVDPTIVANGADPDNVAMHIVATLLNVRSHRISVLNEEAVHDIWREYAANGYFTPSASTTQWNGAQIVQYLTSTITL